jgi:SSS family solute:Na+ symporter
LLTVVPGLILFTIHPEYLLGNWLDAQHQADKGYINLVKEVLPIGMRGLLLAVLFSAVQATITSVVNSTATILTVDIYVPLFRRGATDSELVTVGVWASIFTVCIGILIAIWLSASGGSIFQYMQTLNAFFAPPFAAIFLLGLLTRRVNATGAMFAIVGGFLIGVTLKVLGAFFSLPAWSYPFANQAAITWTASMLLCVIGSTLHKGATVPPGEAAVTLWDNPAVLRQGLGDAWYENVIGWTVGFFIVIVVAMVVFSSMVFPTR